MPIDLTTFMESIKGLNAWEQAWALWRAQLIPLTIPVILTMLTILGSALLFDVPMKKTFWGLILIPILLTIIYFTLYGIFLYLFFGI